MFDSVRNSSNSSIANTDLLFRSEFQIVCVIGGLCAGSMRSNCLIGKRGINPNSRNLERLFNDSPLLSGPLSRLIFWWVPERLGAYCASPAGRFVAFCFTANRSLLRFSFFFVQSTHLISRNLQLHQVLVVEQLIGLNVDWTLLSTLIA